MHLSGLFEPWRVRIATGITYLLGSEEGGAFLCYPDGIDHPPAHDEVACYIRRLVLDSDSIFHGVELVPGCDRRHRSDRRQHPPGAQGKRTMASCAAELPASSKRSRSTSVREELRLSLSWKAYCFADEAECTCVYGFG